MQKFLRTLMLAALLLPFASQAQETLTVHDGTTTNSYIPVYGYYADAYLRCQVVYPASELSDMAGGTISSMTFYASQSSVSWGDANFEVKLTEITSATLSGFDNTASTTVYTGALAIVGNQMTVTFTTPYAYQGGNLLVEVDNIATGTYVTSSWYGETVTGASVSNYSYSSFSSITSGYQRNFIPKTTFAYEADGDVSCYAVKGLNVSDVSGHTVTLSWSDTSNSGATYDIYQIAPSADNDSIIDTNLLDNTSEYSYTITGLAPETSFRFGVAANCGADGPSNTRFVNATTTVACPVPTNVSYTLTSSYSTVDVAWHDNNASAWELRYWTGTDTSEIIQLEDTVYSIENLLPNTNYKFQVRAVCGDEDGNSQWTPASGRSFTTPLACRVPIQLTAVLDPAEPTTATITWVDTIASAWQVAFNGDTNDLIDVTENSITFDTLTPETTYTIMVRANCGDFVSPWTNVLSFEPSAKTVVGTAQNTSFYALPIYPYYEYSLSEQIYTAAELGEAGAITSVDFIYRGTETRNIDVYMVNTSDSVFTDNFVPVTGSDLVFSGNVNFTANTWTTIQFDVPFIYNGASNVMLVVDDNTGSYSSSASGVSFVTFNTSSNQAIYDYQDDENYSTSNPQLGDYPNGGVTNKKNYVRFMKGEAPECFAVSNLTIVDSLTTSESITITWEDTINSNATYTVYLFGEEDTITDQASGMEYTFENLEATTGYTFGVTANCGDEETPMRTVSGRTDCEGGSCNIQLVLHDSYGDGWNGNAISVVQAGESLGSYTISDGDSATYNVSVCSGAPVSFSWTAGSYPDETSFEILDGGGLTAYSCTDGSNISGTFTTLNDACPSCMPVMDMTVDSISSESVTISWTSEAENFLFFLDGEEYEGSADGNTITIDELEPSSTYTFGVIVVCDADDSSSMATITFSTPCVPFTVDAETPFFEGFEGTDFAPNCWINEHISGPGSQLWQRNTSSSYVHEGSASAKLPDMDATTYTNLVTPNITINSQDDSYRVSFWMYRVSSTKPNEGVRVWANTLPTTDGGVELMHIRRGYGMGTITETAQGWYKYTAIIPDSLLESFYIVFEGISEYGNASYIDDITIDRAPSCVAVTDFSIDDSSITAHAATFEWESEGTSFQFEYKLHNDTTWTVVETSDNPYELTGLEANTHYDARVKVLCENDASDYSSVRDFWTLISCPAPTNLRAVLTPGDGTVATVVWTDTDGTAWQVCIPGEEDSTFIPVTDTTAYSFTDLTPETNYTVLVRRNCEDEEEGFSTWTSVTFQPTLKIVVGTPASTSNYMPTNSNYNYSLTQQIYTAAELGNTPGAIMSVDFMNGGTEKTRTIDVYMISTTDSTISTFIPVTASDLVFSGTVTFTPNVWTSLVFDSPFMFDGTSNVLLVVDDNNGSYSYGLSCKTFNAPNQAIYVYSDGTNYNPFAPSSYSGTVLSVKNHVRFLLGEPPTCLPVSDLTVDETATTANSITLTWSDTNAVNNYNIYIINGDNDSLVGTTTEMTYTITDLEATTGYTFGVTANCGDGESTMRTVSGRTDCLGGSCNIELVLHDSYGDGWTGNAISVVQAGESLGSYTIDDGSSANYNVSVCSGAPVSFSWTEGSYPYDTSFEIKDGAGMTVYTCTDGSNISGTFTTIADACPSCLGVSNLTVDDSSITSNSIAISWTGTADNYSIYIGETYVGTTTETSYTFTGLTPANNYNLGVRVICSDEDSSTIVYTNAATLCGVIDVFPYSQTFDGEPACWTKVDADGDGYNWELVSGAMHSASYDNDLAAALTPDNWLITPPFEFAAGTNYEVTWNANPQDASWPAEHYGLYVSTTDTAIASFTMIQDWTLTAAGHVPVVDLSNYSGQTVYLALRHWNCTDQFRIAIDNFEVREQAGDNQITVTLTQNNPMYGSVAGSGVYTIGDSVTVTATASAGYIFNRWVDESGVTVSNDNPYTFVAATDVTLEAIFLSSSATTYTITVQVNDSTMGTAIGGGVYAAGDVAALSATANPGYSFVNWTQVSGYGENVVSTEPTFSITVTGDKTFVANFESDSASCIVYGDTTTATACDSYTWNGQAYTQSGTYFQTLPTLDGCDSILTLVLTINNSVAVTITDSAETSYTWNGQTYTESGVYTWTGTTVAGCDSTVTLVLTIGGTQPTTYTVTVHYNATMGNVTGIPTGPVAAGSQVTLTANPLTGYHFLNWSTGDTTRTIILTVNGDINITANFEADQAAETYTVTVNYDATMGTVTGIPMAPVAAGTQVTLTATALPGYAFVNWSTGDTLATITITVNANIEITANFRSTIGIEDADMNSVSIFSANSTIYVKGAEGQNIYVYDLNGRTIATKTNATETMEIPMEQTGVYLVRVGNASAKRVIVMR